MSRINIAFAVFAVTWATGSCHAQIFIDYTWNNPSGGSYHTFSNWTPSAGFGGIPDKDNEGAVFNLAQQFGVQLTTNITTNSAVVRNGTVQLALGTAANPRTYTLNSLRVDPTISGADPRLIVSNGTLRAKTIRVADGGRLDLDTNVANFDNGSATVSGTGSKWNQTTGFLRVGENGTGTLLIEDGGYVFNANGAAIGRFAGSDGTATVTGDGSTLDVNDNLTIGQEGMGELVVEAGGDVESVLGRIAFDEDAVGTATVTGTGSNWTNSSELRVGESGDGTLRIEDGGTLSNTDGSLGFNAGSVGTATVTGIGSTWTNNGELSIGESGQGTLIISAGGQVTTTNGSIRGGNILEPSSAATVTGVGSKWTLIGGLVVGGGLSVESKGSVQVTQNVFVGGSITIYSGAHVTSASGQIVGGTGTVVGAGSTWNISGELALERSLVPVTGGPAVLNILSGGSVNVEENIALSLDCSLSLDGGILSTTAFDFQGGQFNWLSGNLHIDEFGGSLTTPGGGTLAPGRSAGSTDILGDYTQQDGGILQIEIGGTQPGLEYDSVEVMGDVALDGLLELALLDGFVPDPMSTFTILTSNEILGAFDNVANDQRINLPGGGSFRVHYGNGSAFDPAQIVLSDFLASLTADFDQDGDVDGRDFLIWQRNPSVGQLSDWMAQYGSVLPPSANSTAVPEPSSVLFFLIATASHVLKRHN